MVIMRAQREDQSKLAAQIVATSTGTPLTTKQTATVQAIISAPEGYELVGVEETRSPTPAANWPIEPETEFVATYQPKQYEVPTSLFGLGTGTYNPVTGEMTEELTTRTGQKITLDASASLAEVVAGQASLSPNVQMAYTGMNLATVTGVGVGVPVAGVGGLLAVGAGEAVKKGFTGQDLTIPEAVGLAGIGELGVLVGGNIAKSVLAPKVQTRVDTSYKAAVEQGQLYTPSLVEKIGMKITGVNPSGLAQEIVGAGDPIPVSFRMLQQDAVPGDYFWSMPTPRSSEVFAARTPSLIGKSWAGEHWIKHVSGGLSFAQVQREISKPIEFKLPYVPEAVSRSITVTGGGVQASQLFPSLTGGLFSQPRGKTRITLPEPPQLIDFTDLSFTPKKPLKEFERTLPFIPTVPDVLPTPRTRRKQAFPAPAIEQPIPTRTLLDFPKTPKVKLPSDILPFEELKPRTRGETTPFQIPAILTTPITKQDIKQTPILSRVTVPGFRFPQPKTRFDFPFQRLGDVYSPSGRGRGLRGRWKPVSHDVKTWEAMLETFGFSSKKSGKTPGKSFNNIAAVMLGGRKPRKTKRNRR